MTEAQRSALLCGGFFMLITAMILAAVVYKIQIEPMKRRKP